MTDRKELAHTYVSRQRFAVIPVHYNTRAGLDAAPVCSCPKGVGCPSVGKHPMIFGWTTEGYARTGADVEEFWTLYPNANIGIVTGKASNDGSGDLLVLDVDADKGGLASYEKLFTSPPGELRIVSPTRQTTTGGGGFHLYYRLPAGTHLLSRPLDRELYPGIDIRADKGMVVAAGSESGKGSYTTDDDENDPIGRIPGWLLEVVAGREDASGAGHAPLDDRRYASPETVEADSLPPRTREKLTAPGLIKGAGQDRSDVFHNLVCDLWEAGCTEGQAVTLLTPWCQRCDPPLYPGREAQEVHRTWTKREAKRDRVEVDVSGIYNPSALAYAPQPASLADPEEIAALAARLDRTVDGENEILDFGRLLRRAGNLAETAALIVGYEMVDWEGLLTTPLPPPDWILPDLMERGQFVCIYAPEGHGKSLVMQQQMGAAVAGRIVAGGELNPAATVLYLDQENNQRDLHGRYLASGFKHEELERLYYCFADGMPYLHTSAGARELIGLVLKYRPDVVVLDTFARFVEGEQNAPEAPNAFFKFVAKPLTDAGVTVVVLDHTAKDTKTRGPIGSRAKTATPHLVWRMEKMEDDSETLLLTLEKDRRGNCPPYLRVHKKSLPLDFEFEPLTQEEYEQEKVLGRLGGDQVKNKGGRPRVEDEEKINAVVAKLDVAGVRPDASWSEALTALHLSNQTFDRRFLKRAMDRRAGTEWDDE